jgi:hypothetical protein
VFLLGRLKDKTPFPSPLGVAESVTRLMLLFFENFSRSLPSAVLGMSKSVSKMAGSQGLKDSLGLLAGQQACEGNPVMSLGECLKMPTSVMDHFFSEPVSSGCMAKDNLCNDS